MWRTIIYSFVYHGIVLSHAAFADGTLGESVLMKGTALPLITIRKGLASITVDGAKEVVKENSVGDDSLNETSKSITSTPPNSPISSPALSSSFSGSYVDKNALNSETPGSGGLVLINITDYSNQLYNSEHGSFDITQLIGGGGSNVAEILDQILGTSINNNSSNDYLGFLSSDNSESYDINQLISGSNGSGSYDINQLIGGSNGSGSYDINQLIGGSNGSGSYDINQLIGGSNESVPYDTNKILGGSNGSEYFDINHLLGSSNGSGSYNINQILGGSNGSGYFYINQILGGSNGSGSFDINQFLGGSNVNGSLDTANLLGGSSSNGSLDIAQFIGGSSGSGSLDISHIIGGSSGGGSLDIYQLIGGGGGRNISQIINKLLKTSDNSSSNDYSRLLKSSGSSVFDPAQQVWGSGQTPLLLKPFLGAGRESNDIDHIKGDVGNVNISYQSVSISNNDKVPQVRFGSKYVSNIFKPFLNKGDAISDEDKINGNQKQDISDDNDTSSNNNINSDEEENKNNYLDNNDSNISSEGDNYDQDITNRNKFLKPRLSHFVDKLFRFNSYNNILKTI